MTCRPPNPGGQFSPFKTRVYGSEGSFSLLSRCQKPVRKGGPLGSRTEPALPYGRASDNPLQVLDFNRLDRLGQVETKYPRIEIEFGVKRSFDVFRAPKPVLLAFKGNIGDGQLFLAERGHHHFRLVRRHDLVFQSLEE